MTPFHPTPPHTLVHTAACSASATVYNHRYGHSTTAAMYECECTPSDMTRETVLLRAPWEVRDAVMIYGVHLWRDSRNGFRNGSDSAPCISHLSRNAPLATRPVATGEGREDNGNAYVPACHASDDCCILLLAPCPVAPSMAHWLYVTTRALNATVEGMAMHVNLCQFG